MNRMKDLSAVVLKKTIFFSLTTAVVALLATSCQPRDTQLGDVNINSKKNDPSTSDANAKSMTQTDLNNLKVVLVERSIESLHMMKAYLNSDYATANGLAKKTVESSSDETEVYLQTINSKSAQGKKTNHRSLVDYKVEEWTTDPSGQLRRLTLIKNVFAPTTTKGETEVKVKGKMIKTDFSVKTVMERIVIRPTTEDQVYSAKITRIDETSSFADKNTTLYQDLQLKFSWNGDVTALDQALKVSSLKIKAVRQGDTKGSLDLDLNNLDLQVQMGQCVSISGVLDAMKIQDSTFEAVQGGYTSEAQGCAVRPVVDLTRMIPR